MDEKFNIEYIKFFEEEEKNKDTNIVRFFLNKAPIKFNNVKSNFAQSINLNDIKNGSFLSKKEILNIYLENNPTVLKDLRNKSIKLNHSKKVKKTEKINYLTYPIDNTYLLDLLDKINFDINNDYIKGLINILKDNCYNINSIGLKIVIAKYLKNINCNDLKVIRVKNDYIKEKYSIVTLKNNNIKFFNKLYFIDNIIFISYLDNDYTITYAIGKNLKNNDIHNKNINEKIISIQHQNLKKYSKTKKEIDIFPTMQYLIYIIEKIKYQYKGIKYNDININKDNLKYWLKYINKNYDLIYKYDLLDMYNYIFDNYNKDKENNSLNIKDNKKLYYDEIEDYYKYDIKLKDYFLNP